MNKVSLDNLGNLFSFLESQNDSILWMRSRGYERQLYVSPNFEQVWGYPAEMLYENPANFEAIVYEADRNIVRKMIQLDEMGNPMTSYFYRIKTLTGEIKYIKDWHYILTDQKEAIIGYAGFAKTIDEQQWWHEQAADTRIHGNQPEQILQKRLFALLKNEAHINAQNTSATIYDPKDKNGKSINLTKREKDCIEYLLLGKSAKQTAAILDISARTVEFHLDNIKQKMGCRTKLELLGKLKTPLNQ